MKTEIIALLIITALTLNSCLIFGDDCDTYVPQKWNIGEYEAELLTQKPILKVGDTLILKFSLAKILVDTAGQQINVDEGLQIFNKITTHIDSNETVNNDFFATDTTIFNVFNQYFDINLIKGDTINPYVLESELIGDYWEVEIQYIAKKPGQYWAKIDFQEIFTSEAKLEDGLCMLGDTQKFGGKLVWKKSTNNQIALLFQEEEENYPDYFGFIVEE